MYIENIPGTIIPDTDLNLSAFSLIETLLSAAGGLSLSQIKAITGLEGTTIQNWVKRGWVSKPKDKKYGEGQLARILMISALRDSMQIEQIINLMAYINNYAEDQSSIAVRESRLFNYLCEAMRHTRQTEAISLKQARAAVHSLILEDEGSAPIDRERLEQALSIMVLFCEAGRIKRQADSLLQELG